MIVNRKEYKRDNVTIAKLKHLQDYKCQLCGITILKQDGSFYIEAAHIEAKHKGGKETIENILILCPNHHKEFDFGTIKILKRDNSYVHFSLNRNEYKVEFSFKE